ncbi:MAG: hypothetical protein Q7T55_02480, partial [Solirubrobacteraceae bacterium]|nr:hypothetical protein [Solirubrobacteraceae bacterium]
GRVFVTMGKMLLDGTEIKEGTEIPGLGKVTPDAAGKVYYVDRRERASEGVVAVWGSGADPARNSDRNWNGSAWVACEIDTASTSTVRDALGANTYSYCNDRETGKGTRSVLDVSGKTMAEVYAQWRAAGYDNLSIDDPAVLGSATFPANSAVFYQSNPVLTTALTYLPGGEFGFPAVSSVASQYTPEVSAGGNAMTQPAGTGCNSPESATGGHNSTTLEGMIAAKTGTPCAYAPNTFVYEGVSYSSGPQNEWWGNSTLSLAKIGTAPINSGPAPGHFTTNTLLRLAFVGTGTRPVTYYACKERFSNGSIRNCVVIGTGSYEIETLGDGRALTLVNPPAQAASLNYQRVFIERAGQVFYGYKTKPSVANSGRLTTTATAALLTQLGVPVNDPSLTPALTAASYQGTWDLIASGDTSGAGTVLFMRANGSSGCMDRLTGASFACTVTITDPATGAFTYAADASTKTGTMAFITGQVTGSWHDPAKSPADGILQGGRR